MELRFTPKHMHEQRQLGQIGPELDRVLKAALHDEELRQGRNDNLPTNSWFTRRVIVAPMAWLTAQQEHDIQQWLPRTRSEQIYLDDELLGKLADWYVAIYKAHIGKTCPVQDSDEQFEMMHPLRFIAELNHCLGWIPTVLMF